MVVAVVVAVVCLSGAYHDAAARMRLYVFSFLCMICEGFLNGGAWVCLSICGERHGRLVEEWNFLMLSQTSI